ncbi:MAG: plastocyanin/azurin family copper-binding protein [Acidimicrobiales bacterium]
MALAAPATGPASAASAGVEIRGSAFIPSEVRVAVGDSVTWTNADADLHTVQGGPMSSPEFGSGATFSYTFTEAGTYDYICRVHTFMTGSVVVGSASVAAPSGTVPPATRPPSPPPTTAVATTPAPTSPPTTRAVPTTTAPTTVVATTSSTAPVVTPPDPTPSPEKAIALGVPSSTRDGSSVLSWIVGVGAVVLLGGGAVIALVVARR